MCAWFVPRPEPPAGTGCRSADPAGLFSSSNRREALRLMAAALVAAGVLPWPAARAVENDALAFGSGSLEGVLRALGATLDPSPQIRLTVPDFVENGAGGLDTSGGLGDVSVFIGGKDRGQETSEQQKNEKPLHECLTGKLDCGIRYL